MKQQNQMAKLCLGAVIAALYTVLTLALPVLSYGPIQFRLAEGMTVLAWLCPEAIPGLTLGCFLSNLIGSPYALDWIMGTLATFIAALWTARVSKRWMAPIPPVLCNMVIIGAEIAWFETNGFGSAFSPLGRGTASPWASAKRLPAAWWGHCCCGCCPVSQLCVT